MMSIVTSTTDGLALNNVLPLGDRSTRVDGLCIEEKRLVELLPSIRPYSHIFYTDPATVSDLKDDFLVSKLWRMNNLYKVKTKEGGDGGELAVPFKMKFQQLILYLTLLNHPRVVVLKSRQIGISTVTVLMYGDDMIVMPFLNVGIVAQNQDAANGLKDKISFAFQSMEPEIREFLGVSEVLNNDSAFSLTNGSNVVARLSFRSGTLHRFAWTEVGKIAKDDPKRITETQSGSLQAIAPNKENYVVNESTAEGDNYFKRLYDGAVASVGLEISNKEVRPLFFSWLIDTTCNSSANVELKPLVLSVIEDVTKEYNIYIHSPEYQSQIGNFVYPKGFRYELSISQKSWLAGTLKELDYDLELFYREYPHTPASAFYASSEGVWYKDALSLMRNEGRLVETAMKEGDTFENKPSVLYNPDYEVWAVTDIGLKDRFFIIYCQAIETGLYDDNGLEKLDIRILGNDYGTDMKTDKYAELMWAKPYDIDVVVLPHDGGRNTVLKDSLTVEDDFIEMGFGTLVTSKSVNKVDDILKTRRVLSHTRIDRNFADELVVNLSNYKKKFNKVLRQYESEPVHDIHSHGADAMRGVATLPYGCSKKRNKPSYTSYQGYSGSTFNGGHGSISI